MSTQENTVDSAAEAAGTVSAYRSYPVAPGYRLNVRSGPSTGAAVVRTLPAGSSVPIRCQRHGQRVIGPYGTSDIWDCIGSGQYVSDAYVYTGSSGLVAPVCGS
ncbi:SH3 domain-containing protein [Streptomyces sp. NPDC047117]|uniref:SH3 domain-containing protein n=1 Tax=unclassified Streptomyces TaxID=2593676 RepID=UPI0033DA52E2